MTYKSIRNAAILLLLLYFGTNTNAQTLVWEENFDAAAVNPTTWTYDFGDGCERGICGWGNSELEYYTSRTENARIEDGKLLIEARREAFQGKPFTSARLKTEGRMHFKYGTVEARIKLPNVTRGLWPAFWTLGTIGGAWPAIGEIDMMEVGAGAALQANLGNKQVSSAAHWSNATGAHEYNVFSTNAAVDLSLDYHLYKMVWTSQYIKMYLDNVEYYSFDISGGAAANLSEFHQPHFVLLNLAVGGQYTGLYTEGSITAPLPSKMYVDYVKLYQNAGDVLYLGDNNAFSGKYGVLTDNTPVNAALNYASDATLYYWNNLTVIPNATPFEGANMWAVHANANNWFGMGVENQYKNLINFASGSLNFKFKTTYQGQFKIGVKTGHGESWINFPTGNTDFGVQRNGNWSTVKIPLSNFQNPSLGRNVDWKTLKNAFMFAGDPATSATDFYFDDVYYSDIIAVNPAPSVNITSPANSTSFAPLSTIAIAADATDADGTVAKVEFYQGTTLLGTDFTAPYTYSWASVPTGNYLLTAKATDNDNNTTTSTPVTIAVSPDACTGTATSGDYSYEVYTNAGTVYFKFHPLSPITGSNACIIYLREGSGGAYPGYNMTAFGSDFIFSRAVSNSTATSFYFTYNVPSGGERNSSANPHAYVVGTTCVTGAPTVSITSPTEGSSFSAPASITINATAADANGTVSNVDFYNGTTLLGSDNSSPYSYTWTGVAAGNYSLTAKATDNSTLTTTSTAVNIVVTAASSDGYCGTAANGDYKFKAETVSGVVTITFHPLTPIAGCAYALVYVREGAAGGYPGYTMSAAGSDFIFTKTIANGTPLSIYFTYQTPPSGERNSSATPHSYTVGTNCTGVTGSAPTISITSPANNTNFTEPTTITFNANAADADGTIAQVEFYNGATLIGTDATSPYSIDWANVAAGNYNITAKATDNSSLTTISSITRVIVNIDNSTGFCGTLANGDYSYKAETSGGNVVFSLHPLGAAVGSNNALIYVREGGSGGYPGYQMAAVGGDFRFIKAIANGTPLSIYFTYNVPGFGDRNSSATPHSYTVGTNCLVPIPVELTTFKAKLSNNTTILDWQTASERNNKAFDIERSNDGTSYATIGQVKGNGTTNTPHAYTFTDQSPLWGLGGVNYYRLRQTDFDGKETLSPVVTVFFGKNSLVIKNTLAYNSVTVIVGDASPVMVSIFNVVGQQMYATRMQGTQQIDVSNWLSGLYVVRTSTGEVSRFVKQ